MDDLKCFGYTTTKGRNEEKPKLNVDIFPDFSLYGIFFSASLDAKIYFIKMVKKIF